MGAGMEDRRQVASETEVDQSTTRIGDPVYSDLIQRIKLAFLYDAGEDARTVLKENLDAAHNQWAALSSKYSLNVNADSTVQFRIPGNLTLAEAWSDFRKDMALGAGGEGFGFSETKIPDWFPKTPGETATIGSNVGIFGAGMTRQDQAAFFEQQGLRMGTMSEGVEALVAQQICIADSNEKVYQELAVIAKEFGKPIINEEVVAEWDRRKLEKFLERWQSLSPHGLIGFEDLGPDGPVFVLGQRP